MNIKEGIARLQGLSETARKIILWGITGTLAVVLAGWWLLSVKASIQSDQNPSIKEQLRVESLEERLQNIPINVRE